MAYTVHKSVRGGDGHHRFGAGVRGLYLSAALREHGRIHCRKRQGGGMPHLLGQGQRLLTPLLRLVGIAQPPEDRRKPDQVLDPGRMPTAEGGSGGRLGGAAA
jgi:hypothetical protein